MLFNNMLLLLVNEKSFLVLDNLYNDLLVNTSNNVITTERMCSSNRQMVTNDLVFHIFMKTPRILPKGSYNSLLFGLIHHIVVV